MVETMKKSIDQLFQESGDYWDTVDGSFLFGCCCLSSFVAGSIAIRASVRHFMKPQLIAFDEKNTLGTMSVTHRGGEALGVLASRA